MEYEYGIMMRWYKDEPHRSNMTKEEAEAWLNDWLMDGGKEGIFWIIRRPKGAWEKV